MSRNLVQRDRADNALDGSAGNETPIGNGNGTRLVASAGTDRLINNWSAGFYGEAAGNGKATIINGASSNAAASNALDFGPGISDEKLWLILSGNDLQIEVMGSQSQMTVAGWFAGTESQRQEITAEGLELDIQVSKVVLTLGHALTDGDSRGGLGSPPNQPIPVMKGSPPSLRATLVLPGTKT